MSIKDTNILKGIAICAMLLHHIYACPPDGYGPFRGVLNFLGEVGKCCVAMFLFCSGYGLAVKYSEEKHGLKSSAEFVLRRLLKFYANYWFIFLIFVPIGVFVFDIPLTARYGEHVNIIKRLIFDFLGIQGTYSYNITWWFNKLIILFYLLFPILFLVTKKLNWCMLPTSLILSLFGTKYLSSINYYDLLFWQFPFVLGILWRMNENGFGRLSRWINGHRVYATVMTIAILLLAITFRMFPIIPQYSGQHIDPYIAVSFALITMAGLNRTRTSTVLAFLGRHSSNIYLTHTFFGGYWFASLLYGQVNFMGGGHLCSLSRWAFAWESAS